MNARKPRTPQDLLEYAFLKWESMGRKEHVRIYEEAFNSSNQWPEIANTVFCEELERVFHERYLGGLMFSAPCDLDEWMLTIVFDGVKPSHEEVTVSKAQLDAALKKTANWSVLNSVSLLEAIWALLKNKK